MATKRKITWHKLDKTLPAFTSRNTVMVDLANGTAVQMYSANVKINLYEWANVSGKTFYRTKSAKNASVDYAFSASAFGLPDMLETAPQTAKTKTQATTTPKTPAKKPTPEVVSTTSHTHLTKREERKVSRLQSFFSKFKREGK